MAVEFVLDPPIERAVGVVLVENRQCAELCVVFLGVTKSCPATVDRATGERIGGEKTLVVRAGVPATGYLMVVAVQTGMAIRRLLRGSLSESELEGVARAAAKRQGQQLESVETLDADNWLSTPAVVNEALFVKVISTQNTLVQGLLTASRNLGLVSSGVEPFFERFNAPLEMAEHELEATREMRALGVNVPRPVEAFEHDGYGVLVLEYLPAFETLDSLDLERARRLTPTLFRALARMHGAGLAHGDLRGENVLVSEGELYFIDATNVRDEATDEARAYDVACALAALEPVVGASTAVTAAAGQYHDDVLLDAERYLDFVNFRPDHTFDVRTLRSEIEKTVQAGPDATD